jgi:CBS-domain-containing membrane protein
MHVADIMSRDVVTVTTDTAYKKIWQRVFSKHVNAVPVVDAKGKLAGLITREDLLAVLYPKYQDVMENLETDAEFSAMEDRFKELAHLTAAKLMAKSVVFTRTDTLIMRALSRMMVQHLNQLPVLDENDVVVGIVTKGDVFYSLFRANKQHSPARAKKPKKSK